MLELALALERPLGELEALDERELATVSTCSRNGAGAVARTLEPAASRSSSRG